MEASCPTLMWPFKSVNGISQERKRVKTEVKVLTSVAAGGHRPWSALLLLKEKRKEKKHKEDGGEWAKLILCFIFGLRLNIMA